MNFNILTKTFLPLLILFLFSACSEQFPTKSNQPTKSIQQINGNSISAHANEQTIQAEVEYFSLTLYPLLANYCADCHDENGTAAPVIAHSDVNIARLAVIDNQKINFVNPANSRIVVKLKNEFHYCWSDCNDNAADLQNAIRTFAILSGKSASDGGATLPSNVISSNSLTLADGVLDTGAKRYNDQVIAFFEFKEGEGNIAMDTSGVAPAIELTLDGPTWAPGQGIEIQSGMAISTAEMSRKLYDQIAGGPTATNAYSIEAWVIPANVTQEGPARLVSYSDGTQLRNFTMGQNTYNYVFRNRTDSPDISPNGTPALETVTAEEVLQASQQHVIMTFDPDVGRKIYVNGELKNTETLAPSSLATWDPNHIFIVGNETTNNRLFQGVVQMVAIHKSTLTPDQVMQNFDAGVGVKFSMTFDVSETLGVPDNFIQFEVSELDRFSYLFNKPVFISSTADGFRVKNIQIAVNGQVPIAGQTWRNIDTTITQAEQSLFNMAAVIGKDLGPEADQFSVVFEVLGAKQNVIVEELPPTPILVDVADTSPRVGIRTFEQVTHTMASITGVDANTNNVKNTYLELKQQLPSLPNINGFLAAHQVGISKLALEYCDALVEDSSLRNQFFGNNSIDFSAPASTAFNNPGQVSALIQIINEKMIGINLTNQPDTILIEQELMTLINDLTVNCTSPAMCDANKTKSVVKASCAAVLGSAALTIQ